MDCRSTLMMFRLPEKQQEINGVTCILFSLLYIRHHQNGLLWFYSQCLSRWIHSGSKFQFVAHTEHHTLSAFLSILELNIRICWHMLHWLTWLCAVPFHLEPKLLLFFFANLLSNQNRHISECVCKGTVILEFLCMIIWCLGTENYGNVEIYQLNELLEKKKHLFQVLNILSWRIHTNWYKYDEVLMPATHFRFKLANSLTG